ncbi:MAG: riboflavin synthase [Thermoleophilia bacterium]
MFTGLVETVGLVSEISPAEAGVRVVFSAPAIASELSLGESVAVDGACLTVVAFDDDGFAIDAVAETMRRTALGDRHVGDRVNLERAIRADARLGGHIVQGHVDGTGVVTAARHEGESVILTVEPPADLLRYVVEKGSITIDGISLTVAGRDDTGFHVALIPHTMEVTTIGPDRVGRRVNLEMDVVAKYVEAFTQPYLRSREAP